MQKESLFVKSVTRMQKSKIESMRKWVHEYDTDPRAVERFERQECKACFYQPPRVALQAFTDKKCKNCEINMTFHNSNTDDLCKKCACMFELCKFCGGEMD